LTKGDKVLTAMSMRNGIATTESRLLQTVDFCIKKSRQTA